MSNTTIIKARWILTVNQDFELLTDSALIIQNDRIQAIVPLAELAQMEGLQQAETIDLENHVLMPGLINTHHHMYQTLTRAVPDAIDKELFDWLKTLYPIWAGLTPDMVSHSSELAMAELLLSGCTTTTDHHYVFPAGHEDAIDRHLEEEFGKPMKMKQAKRDAERKESDAESRATSQRL